jgi:hypothetical protein
MGRLVLTSKPAASQASNCKAAPDSLPPLTTALHMPTGGAAPRHRSTPCVSPALPQPTREPPRLPGAPTLLFTPQLCNRQQPYEPRFTGEQAFQAGLCRDRPRPRCKAGARRRWQAGWVAGVAARCSTASKRGCSCSCWGKLKCVSTC